MCLMEKKKNNPKLSSEGMLRGCSGFFSPESKRGHQVCSYIKTLLITTSILPTYQSFHSPAEPVDFQRSCCEGFQELINPQQATVRHLGNDLAKQNAASRLTDPHLLLHTVPLDKHTSANAVFIRTCSGAAGMFLCFEPTNEPKTRKVHFPWKQRSQTSTCCCLVGNSNVFKQS